MVRALRRGPGSEVLQRAEEQVYLHFLLILRAMLRAADDPAAWGGGATLEANEGGWSLIPWADTTDGADQLIVQFTITST